MPESRPPSFPSDGAALEKLLRRLRPRLRYMLQRFRVPPEDAEDLVQEALLAALVKWERIHNPEAWLLATLKNRCLLYWRRRRQERLSTVEDEVLEGLTRPQPAPQESEQAGRDLEALLAALPERHRDLLRLRYLQGLSPAEVAARLGYRQASVRKVASRSLSRLAEEVAGAEAGTTGTTGDITETEEP